MFFYNFLYVKFVIIKLNMNILSEANKIVNERSEEKEREYGPFIDGMESAAKILSGMTGMDLDYVFMYKAMIALKLSRESYKHKEDNLLDAVAYIGALNNHFNSKDKMVVALQNFKNTYLDLNDNFNNDYMCQDYPFVKSFEDIDITNWIEKSIERIKKSK